MPHARGLELTQQHQFLPIQIIHVMVTGSYIAHEGFCGSGWEIRESGLLSIILKNVIINNV